VRVLPWMVWPNPAAAWLGWLRKAAERTAPKPKPLGCPQCLTGWLPDEYGYPSATRCPTCKPLKVVAS
jgi:hypothetical protein